MVIGHTPQFTLYGQGITTACNDKIIRTDIGGSTAFDKFTTSDINPRARQAQVMEIITNLQTKESTMRVLFYE